MLFVIVSCHNQYISAPATPKERIYIPVAPPVEPFRIPIAVGEPKKIDVDEGIEIPWEAVAIGAGTVAAGLLIGPELAAGWAISWALF